MSQSSKCELIEQLLNVLIHADDQTRLRAGCALPVPFHPSLTFHSVGSALGCFFWFGVQIETYGALAKTEKIFFILEQVNIQP